MKFFKSLFAIAPATALLVCTAWASGAGFHEVPASAHNLKNPLDAKQDATIVAGAGVYKAQCAGCHGPAGVPVKKFPRLKEQPSNLTGHGAQHHTDGDIYWIIGHGLPGGMPAFDDLSETQRWQAVIFVRHLGKDAPKWTAQLPEGE